MKTNERVILIKGDATKWYDQAIFIVNKDMPPEKIPVDFVAEAEKIINTYIAKKNKQTGQKMTQPAYNMRSVPARPALMRSASSKRFDFILNMVMLAGCLAIAFVFLFGLFS